MVDWNAGHCLTACKKRWKHETVVENEDLSEERGLIGDPMR